jgi:hypothetical protein
MTEPQAKPVPSVPPNSVPLAAVLPFKALSEIDMLLEPLWKKPQRILGLPAGKL